MERILVTGASGFIGRRLVPLLLEHYGKEQLCCLVHSKDSPHEEAGQRVLAAAGVSYLKIELLDPSSLARIPKGFTTIVHLAATTDTNDNNFSANDIGTKNLLEALGPLSPGTHFVYPGTSAAYAGRADFSKPVTLATSTAPTNEYARSKMRAEAILSERSQREGLTLTVLRLNTVYGSLPRTNSLLDVLRGQIMRNSLVTRLNWPGLTSIVHVDDVCRRLVHAVRSPPRESTLYLVSAESLTLATMYERLCGQLGKPYRRINLPSWFWALLSFALGTAHYVEWLLPKPLYILLWRAHLVAASVLYFEPNDTELKGGLPDKTFSDSISILTV